MSTAIPVLIANTCASMSNAATSWAGCWGALLAGRCVLTPGGSVINGWANAPPLAMLADDGMRSPDALAYDRTHALTRSLAQRMRSEVLRLLAKRPDMSISILVTTSHGESAAISRLSDWRHGIGQSAAPAELWKALLDEDLVAAANQGLGLSLPGCTISAACASGIVAASHAADLIETETVHAVLLIAVDAFSRVAAVGFNNLGALARLRCRPFDRDRDGTLIGEGGVAMLIARADVLDQGQYAARIAGSSHNCDSRHLVEPSPSGIVHAIEGALERAGWDSDAVAGIYWHGTGTRQNDRAEALAAAAVFGPRSPACTSTKGCLGHTMGASSAFNLLAACTTLQTGLLPHTSGTHSCEYDNLDLVVHAPRPIPRGPILINALGFGGINAAIAVVGVGGHA